MNVKRTKSKDIVDNNPSDVLKCLKDLYKTKLFPLEHFYDFHHFYSRPLEDADFDTKPTVLLLGQYSTGKTTFVRYILERDFPGMRIGPDHASDKFMVLMYGEIEGVIPGNALATDPTKPFKNLSTFGNSFLNRFQASVINSSVLQSINVIDTPGISSSESGTFELGFDYVNVVRWFVDRVDLILLFFDANKLDISEEMRRMTEVIRYNEDKVRIILNKSDTLNQYQLLKCYGALMWNLGKIFQSPEAKKVYVGSFWDKPYKFDANRSYFNQEQNKLFQDIRYLPRHSLLRKINDLIRRVREAKIHGYIVAEIRREMPIFLGRGSKKHELIQFKLPDIFATVEKKYRVSPCDLPSVRRMQEILENQDFDLFRNIKPKLFENADEMVNKDLAGILASIPQEELFSVKNPVIQGGAMSLMQEEDINPFSPGRCEGLDVGLGERDWIVQKNKGRYDAMFDSLNPVSDKLSANSAKNEFTKSNLPSSALHRIWKLSDIDEDGMLDRDEFALAMYLIETKLVGHDIPHSLPSHLIPPSKRYHRKFTSQERVKMLQK